jgi:hypothetical protein
VLPSDQAVVTVVMSNAVVRCLHYSNGIKDLLMDGLLESAERQSAIAVTTLGAGHSLFDVIEHRCLTPSGRLLVPDGCHLVSIAERRQHLAVPKWRHLAVFQKYHLFAANRSTRPLDDAAHENPAAVKRGFRSGVADRG